MDLISSMLMAAAHKPGGGTFEPDGTMLASIGSYTTGSQCPALTLMGDTLFVGAAGQGAKLFALNVSDPTNITLISSVDIGYTHAVYTPYKMVLFDNNTKMAIVARTGDGGSLGVVDVSNTSAMIDLDFTGISTLTGTNAVVVNPALSYIYVNVNSSVSGFYAYQWDNTLNDIGSRTQIGTSHPTSLQLDPSDNVMYATVGTSFVAYDITTNPAVPAIISSGSSSRNNVGMTLGLDDQYAFMQDTTTIVSYDKTDSAAMTRLQIASLGTANGGEYPVPYGNFIFIGYGNGAIINSVDVTNPSAMVYKQRATGIVNNAYNVVPYKNVLFYGQNTGIEALELGGTWV